jgi:hypothetical protein
LKKIPATIGLGGSWKDPAQQAYELKLNQKHERSNGVHVVFRLIYLFFRRRLVFGQPCALASPTTEFYLMQMPVGEATHKARAQQQWPSVLK